MSEDDDFQYSEAQLESYEMEMEYLTFITEQPIDSECFKKGTEINSPLPRR